VPALNPCVRGCVSVGRSVCDMRACNYTGLIRGFRTAALPRKSCCARRQVRSSDRACRFGGAKRGADSHVVGGFGVVRPRASARRSMRTYIHTYIFTWYIIQITQTSMLSWFTLSHLFLPNEQSHASLRCIIERQSKRRGAFVRLLLPG